MQNNFHFTQRVLLAGTLSIAILFFSVIAGCKKKSDSTPAPTQSANEVWMQNTMFNPATITVPINTTIKWTNKDGFAHTVTSDSGWFDSGTINANGTFSRQFTTVGTFPYRCSIHSMMTAKVIVQ